MASLEAIWRQAKADLVIRGKKGEVDTFLWEHSARVARSAAMIAGLPDVNVRPVDPLALAAAALYHDAGWVVQYREGLWAASEILSRATSDLQRELAAGLLENRLGSMLNTRSRETAALTIRRAGERDAALAEVQILAEAAALDEIGIMAFWQTVRRCTVEGKGIRSVLETWKRQKEYHFWEARVADAFRFGSVRELACRRLQRFGEFMDELERQYEGEDLSRLAGQSSESPLQQLPSA
jgi:HD superfamily phosphodiesterase